MTNPNANTILIDNEPRIALPDKDGLSFFDIKKIVRCQSYNSYTDFYILEDNYEKSGSQKIIVSKGFDHFEEFLISKGFFYRVHNQHIINTLHIKKYYKNSGGYLIMVDNPNIMIPIARARKIGFINHLKKHGIIV